MKMRSPTGAILDARTRANRQLKQYLKGDDDEQYDIMREKWSLLNWELMKKAQDAADSIEKGESTARISPIVLAAGIGFDKLYAKRSALVQPLSFPEPLVQMVRKGLILANSVRPEKAVELTTEEIPIALAPTESPTPPEPPPLPPTPPLTHAEQLAQSRAKKAVADAKRQPVTQAKARERKQQRAEARQVQTQRLMELLGVDRSACQLVQQEELI